MCASASKSRQNAMSYQSRSSEQARRGADPTRRRLAGLVAVGIGILLLQPFPAAQAQSRLLDAPRTAGTVGERFDGYAAARDGASADVVNLVQQVNAERRAVYAQRAATDKVPIEAIGKIYAMEIMKSAPAKTWFLSESGQWSQK